MYQSVSLMFSWETAGVSRESEEYKLFACNKTLEPQVLPAYPSRRIPPSLLAAGDTEDEPGLCATHAWALSIDDRNGWSLTEFAEHVFL